MASGSSTGGGMLLPPVFAKRIAAFVSCASDEYTTQLGLGDELERLDEALPRIQAVVDAVGRGQIQDDGPGLAEWLWKLKDAAYALEDVMDEIEYRLLEEETEAGRKIEVSNAASSFRAVIEHALHWDSSLERLKKGVKGLDEIAAGVRDFFKLDYTLKQQYPFEITSGRNTSSHLAVRTQVFGRDQEREEVLNELLNFNSQSMERNFSILPIVGVGGVGKTTLAQLVYNDERVRNHFRMRMWVCVSNTFDPILLTRKIYESAFGEKPNFDNYNEAHIRLSETFKATRFLLVLDDVWNDQDRIAWQRLLAPFRSAQSGSMILLTTRMSTVGKILMGSATPFSLKGLGATDYWELFKECAFLNEDPNDHEKLQEIGRGIVDKLKGSPLAAKTVGGILNSRLDYQHWVDILNSEIWELEQDENDIMPALRLSYQYLPSHLKPCFTYCSIFPPDCELDKENLVYMWVALGLVEQPISGKRQPEEIANEYFNYLLKKSFFDCRDLDTNPFYVMHDLLHELAQFVSQGECWRVISGKQESIPNTVRHLSVDILRLSELQISNLKNLRTLLLLDGDDSERCHVNLKMFKMLKSLRVLIIPPESTVTSLECIVDLIHLRYLSLDYSSITHAYKSVNRLYHLQVMRFTPPYFGYSGDSPLKRPVCFNLVNLRHLIMPGNSVANISGIGRLTSLQNLKAFRVEEEDGHKICELKDLRQLRELSIQNLENITNVKEVQESNLKDKNHLRTLSLEWDSFGAPEFVEQVLDCLEPHSNLRVLRIKGYMGLSCPRWMTTSSFSELESIVFSCCKGLEVLPPLDQLPYLKSLCLEDMHSVKQVGCRSNERFSVSIFPSLEALNISNCDLLEEWYGQAGTTQWFPCLRKLRVSGCPNLKLLSPLPCSLRELDIGDVAMGALPKLWQGGRSNHVSLLTSSSLASLTVHDCSSLVTIGEGLLLHPELFTTLQTLSIFKCPELKHLPIGGFRKFIFLTELVIKWCPEMQRDATSESFLPSSLRSITIDSCDYLDVMLSKDLRELTFLSSLELRCSPNITSLRSLEVLGRWKALRSLSIDTCPKLVSLEGLQALCPLMFLKIRCSRSVAAALFPSSLPNELIDEAAVKNPSSMLGGHEIERSLKLQHFSFLARTLLPLLQRLLALLTLIYSAIRIFSKLCVPTSSQPLPSTADVSPRAVEVSSLSIDRLYINDLSLLCAVPLRSLSSRVVTIEISYELQSSLEQWMLQNRTSLQELIIFSIKSKQFPLEDLQSLSCLQNLIIHNATSLQSLPILPLSLKVLRIIRCHPMLEMRCLKDSGPDWPKLCDIPTVCIGSYTKQQLETSAAAEHSTSGVFTA